MLPDVDDEALSVLASRFDFSGGQIENIVRKRLVDAVLYGTESDLQELIAYCQEESSDKTIYHSMK
jgi:hypothetical protein